MQPTALRLAAKEYTLLEATSWATLWHYLTHNTVDVIVASPHTVDHLAHREMIRLLQEYPYTKTVLYAPLVPNLAQIVVSLTRHGLDDVVIHGYDDSVDRFRRIFSRQRDRDVIDEFFTYVRPAMRDFPPMLKQILEDAVEHPDRMLTAAEVAYIVKVSESTIYRLMRQVGLASLRPYFRACRILRAYGYLREYGQTVAMVAPKVGYNAPRDLVRDTQLLLRRRPKELATASDLTPATVAYQLWRWLGSAESDSQP